MLIQVFWNWSKAPAGSIDLRLIDDIKIVLIASTRIMKEKGLNISSFSQGYISRYKAGFNEKLWDQIKKPLSVWVNA